MISKINAWTQNIVIAVIISIIIEMLLPNGCNKKYVKVISGLYILYIIINPFLKFDIDTDIDKFEDWIKSENTIQTFSEDDLRKTYIISLENALKSKIEELGYEVDWIEFSVTSDYSEIVKIKVKMKNISYDMSIVKKAILEEYEIKDENLIID